MTVNPTSASTVTTNGEGIVGSTTGFNATNDLIGADPSISEDEKPENKDKVSQNVNPIGTAASSLRTSCFGRPLKRPVRFEVGDLGIDTDTALTIVDCMVEELNLVGAAVGGGFGNTTELHVLNYHQAKKSKDWNKWLVAIDEEHARMIKSNVWTVVDKSELKTDQSILSTTWSMKKRVMDNFGLAWWLAAMSKLTLNIIKEQTLAPQL